MLSMTSFARSVRQVTSKCAKLAEPDNRRTLLPELISTRFSRDRTVKSCAYQRVATGQSIPSIMESLATSCCGLPDRGDVRNLDRSIDDIASRELKYVSHPLSSAMQCVP
ncbi:uncharacterized protein N7477_006193 [Penicillium maclennaniae]|uniref:uncharacterized protein n=1 Tax=Penicillium maclennaniae TaxID=1343394 RepID=UPI00254097D0|nr:uncharacterized protein N7477_006193 [Penicillium maclennaniae]KAJ5670830.1 hypothetical protein N7477_006193 [Penicillium maclennaniae]